MDDVDTWCKLSLGYHATIDVLPIAPFVVSQGLWRGYDPPYDTKLRYFGIYEQHKKTRFSQLNISNFGRNVFRDVIHTAIARATPLGDRKQEERLLPVLWILSIF